MVNDQQQVAAIMAWQQTVDTEFKRLQASAPPEQPGFVEQTGEFIEDSANTLASLGNAVLHNPGAVLEGIGGVGVAVAGGAVALGGGGLTLTGGGAVAGVPATFAGGAIAAGGGLMIGDAARRLAEAATGPDRVEPIQVNWGKKDKVEKTNERIQEKQQKSQEAYEKSWQKANPDGTRKLPKTKEIPPLFGW